MNSKILMYSVVGIVATFAIVITFGINSSTRPNLNAENKTISQNLTSVAKVNLTGTVDVQTKTGSMETNVTLTGTAEQIISDCAPSRSVSQQHCININVIVLHATNDHTYALYNINFTSQLQNKQLTVVGFLITPSKSNITFVDGDVYVNKYWVENYTMDENR